MTVGLKYKKVGNYTVYLDWNKHDGYVVTSYDKFDVKQTRLSYPTEEQAKRRYYALCSKYRKER